MDITKIEFVDQTNIPVAVAYAVASSVLHLLRANREKTDSSFIQDDNYKAIRAMGNYIQHNACYLAPTYRRIVAPLTSSASISLTFAEAHEYLLLGYSVARKGWNGRGIFVSRQAPTANSSMTSPYLYIDTTGLQTDNALAPKCCTPWLPSQTDLEACDWCIYFHEPTTSKEA